MTTTIDMKYNITTVDFSTTPFTYSIQLKAADVIYAQFGAVSGDSYQLGTPENSASRIFASHDSAQTYFFTTYLSGILSAISSGVGDTCVQGDTLMTDEITDKLLDAKQDKITQGSHIAATGTGAVDTNPTNFTTLSGLLGISGGLNNANANQNAMADQLNDACTKLNTLIAILHTQGLLA